MIERRAETLMAADTQRGGAGETDFNEIVAAADTGARSPTGVAAKVLFGTALAWSLFQLWIASPLPFVFRIGVFNSTEARSIHLAFAIFLAFTSYPALARSPRHYIPIQDWIMAGLGALSAGYLYIFYAEISRRVGAPITQDYVAAIVGMILLLEAARRALGPALAIVASIFLIYTFFGPYMPNIIAHRGNNLGEIVNHHWITTSGVFGIALGVSTSFVFLFVLFGALLDKGGAGNYFIKVAFSLMGHMRGGPAKAAVVSSAMTGLISGSSIANVVTTGTFTIPLMKKVGFSSEKAGAVEVSSSVNGQIMPPVMGAAAFLMVEYVGIPYFDVVKHAFLPASISYIALVYIVHLEALKAGMKGLPRAYVPPPLLRRLVGIAFGVAALSALSFGVYYGLGWMRPAFGANANWIIAIGLLVAYVGLIAFGARYPELKPDDPNDKNIVLPEPGPTVKSGLHFILPVVVLVWCLMVERLSPGLSAFYGTLFMIFILATQRPLFAFFRRRGDLVAAARAGFDDLIQGLVAGARNMIGIGVATATAGIIVGAVSQTGVGSALAEVVEVLSGGNMVAILFLTAILSLILGMGLPTTANYIVVSALLAPVIVSLGAQSGLLVPLIAVHLFVFYFGIMADVTPPVGLASFAAAAVSGGDPIKTGVIAFWYSMRTAALPFLFIYNPALLLIGVGWAEGVLVFVIATIAMLVFAAALQGWFIDRCRMWEIPIMLLIAFSLFRPGFWMDTIYPPFERRGGDAFAEVVANVDPGTSLQFRIAGLGPFGDPMERAVLITVPEGATAEDRLDAMGIDLIEQDGRVIIDNVAFGSPGQVAGLDWDQEILSVREPLPQPHRYWIFIPTLLVLAGLIAVQRSRLKRRDADDAAQAAA
jgi:TRAP transporter 4TM/12TM fusion protein